jgi:hypothetical protein
MTPRLLALLCCLAFPTCWAHSELPDAQWCAEGRTVVVASFELAPELLVAEREICRTDPDDGGGSTRECGQFDDDYDIARRTALAVCDAYQADPVGPGDIGTVIHLVDQPWTYNDGDHHELYQVQHGLSGHCVRCETRLRPIAPIIRR